MTYKIILILSFLAIAKVCSYAENYALSCLAGSAKRIRWIDRGARLAFLLSDLCVVAFALISLHAIAGLSGYEFVLSLVPAN